MKVTKLTAPEIESKLVAINERGSIEWQLANDGISTKLVFASFAAAFDFMTKVAAVAEHLDHHPEWSNIYNKVDVRLSTHSVGGVSRLDFEMAEQMVAFMRD